MASDFLPGMSAWSTQQDVNDSPFDCPFNGARTQNLSFYPVKTPYPLRERTGNVGRSNIFFLFVRGAHFRAGCLSDQTFQDLHVEWLGQDGDPGLFRAVYLGRITSDQHDRQSR